jgi:hypothetical protein
MNDYGKRIIKELDHITANGTSPHVIFDDFLQMTLAALEAMPNHARSIISGNGFAEDTEETRKLFERLRSRYPKPYSWQRFSNAFYILLDSADGPDGSLVYADTIGEVYMEWGISNKHSGQFFTPYHLASAMADIQDVEALVYQRLEEAYLKTPAGAFHLLLTNAERVSKFIREHGEDLIVMCAEHFERITVNDCACGSGVMFLAVAEHTPRWALDWGLVQFFGQDIDQTCVMMAKINMMIYGLNGYKLKLLVAMAEGRPEKIEQPTGLVLDVQNWKQEALL